MTDMGSTASMAMGVTSLMLLTVRPAAASSSAVRHAARHQRVRHPHLLPRCAEGDAAAPVEPVRAALHLPGAPRRDLVQAGADVADVGAHPRLDRGVDEGGHRPLVLAVLAQHLAGDGDDGVGVLAAQDVAHPQLVLVVGVGVEQADADRGDPLGLEPPGRGDGLVLVEGPDLGAGEALALGRRLQDEALALHAGLALVYLVVFATVIV